MKGAFRPFFQHPWPEDLPSQCPVCGTEFRTGWNIIIGPNRIGRFLHGAAYWSFLPCLFIAPALSCLFPGMYDGMRSNHAAWLFFFLMFGPPPLLLVASKFTPILRSIECMKCDWHHDYPPGKPAPIPPAQDSP